MKQYMQQEILKKENKKKLKNIYDRKISSACYLPKCFPQLLKNMFRKLK